MCAVGVRETALLVEYEAWKLEERRLFDVFEECVEAGSFGWKKEDEVKTERVAGDPAHRGSFDFHW